MRALAERERERERAVAFTKIGSANRTLERGCRTSSFNWCSLMTWRNVAHMLLIPEDRRRWGLHVWSRQRRSLYV